MNARKPFRGEVAVKAEASPPGSTSELGREIMDELKAIRALVQPTQELSEKALEQMRHERHEALKI
ncbi:hypothetical protein J8J40_34625, partial [Mycobacterium tuberculosis]|nr:hypothetical protein [Mycobacterium tuberculosis]